MPQATAARRTPAIGGSSGTDAGASGETAGADAAAAAGAEAVVVVIVFVPLASPHPNPLPQGERGPIGALLLPLSPCGRGRGPLRSSGRVRGEVLASVPSVLRRQRRAVECEHLDLGPAAQILDLGADDLARQLVGQLLLAVLEAGRCRHAAVLD